MRYLEIGCRALLVVTFAAAAWGKVRDRSSWRSFVGSLRLLGLGGRLAAPTAVALLVAEVVGVLLLAVPTTLLGYLVADALLLVLCAGVAVALRRERPVPCACFGSAGAALGVRHLVRNLLLLAVAVTGTVAAVVGGGWHPAGVVTAVTTGLCLSLLVVRFDDLAALLLPTGHRAVRPGR